MTYSDIHVENARLQQAIIEHLGLQAAQLIFDFSVEGGTTKLNLITVNPRHNQSFLFHSETGTDKLDALQKMLQYVRNYKEKDNSYTIQWTSKQNEEGMGLQTSYFRARNIYEALDKLYFGREVNSLTVYSVVLNPIT
jgi:carbamoylphosphate synthase large subunit